MDSSTPTAFDLKMIEQSRRMACLKAATRMGESTGGTASQVLHDAQVFFNWVTGEAEIAPDA